MKIVVTGAKGQLGSEIHFLSKNTNYPFQFEFIDLDELDLTNTALIQPYLKTSNPDLIINCAAYTAVDKAEDEVELANSINHKAVQEIAEYCNVAGCRLIHISTDYVFSGTSEAPVSEEEIPDPVSVYGQTKLDGERAVQKILSDAYIIRTAWVYSEFGNNFVKTMLRLGKERDELNVVEDQIGSPTWARDLAEAILRICGEIKRGNDQPGIYHFSNEGTCSWYEFAMAIMEEAQVNCMVKPIDTNAFPTKAKRPKYSVLDKTKIKKTFQLSIPHWKDSLKHYFNS